MKSFEWGYLKNGTREEEKIFSSATRIWTKAKELYMRIDTLMSVPVNSLEGLNGMAPYEILFSQKITIGASRDENKLPV